MENEMKLLCNNIINHNVSREALNAYALSYLSIINNEQQTDLEAKKSDKMQWYVDYVTYVADNYPNVDGEAYIYADVIQ
jgi:hypothetical protein